MMTKSKGYLHALLCALALLFCSKSTLSDPKPTFLERYTATALALKANPTDFKWESPEERTERVTELATVLYEAADKATCGGGSRDPNWQDCRRSWAGKRADLAFALLGVAYHESGFAHYVATHCEDGPKGSRCDNGRSRSYLQMREQTCPALTEFEKGTRGELEAAAACAVQVFLASARICSDSDRHGTVTRRATWSEIMAKYAGQQCSASIGIALEISKIQVEQLFAKQ